MQRVPAPRHCLNLFIPTKWNTLDGHDEGDLQSASHGFGVAVLHNFARYDFWQTDVLGTFFSPAAAQACISLCRFCRYIYRPRCTSPILGRRPKAVPSSIHSHMTAIAPSYAAIATLGMIYSPPHNNTRDSPCCLLESQLQHQQNVTSPTQRYSTT